MKFFMYFDEVEAKTRLRNISWKKSKRESWKKSKHDVRTLRLAYVCSAASSYV